jgi:outer membrane protein assembly factor BamB
VLLAVLLVLVYFVAPLVLPEAGLVALLGGLAGTLAILLWWTLFSRAPWAERLGAVGLMIVGLAGTPLLLHESISGGAMGYLFYFLALPPLGVALVAWAVAARRLSGGRRWATMAATVLAACGVWTLARTGGVYGEGGMDLAWRWSATPEERLLAAAGDAPSVFAAAPDVVDARGAWPGFRGPRRDSAIPGVSIATDWAVSPPVELWRRPIGPGWSSFAVHRGLLYTQEQRGDEEIVAAYSVATGEPVWMHSDATRFYESNGGAGPRGTPTFGEGRIYTFGATGILNALDATDGSVVWSRDAGADTGRQVPMWGFSSSPLLVNDIVVIASAGTLAAYEAVTGKPRWIGPDGIGGYSSPHLLEIDGVPQVLLMSARGLTSVAPADGAVLWEHAWDGVPIVQPALLSGGDLLISTGGATGAVGVRRIAVEHGLEGWTSTERWTSIRLKPYFNDFVVHEGHAYGFDGSILACMDVERGERVWKGGRYGNGQLVLLPDQDLLLVISEHGELVLVGATPAGFTEIARFPALEGKTWNHPVLVGDVLLVRNGEEMAAFRLSLVES